MVVVPIVYEGFVFGLCLVMLFLASFLILQPFCDRREIWLTCGVGRQSVKGIYLSKALYLYLIAIFSVQIFQNTSIKWHSL